MKTSMRIPQTLALAALLAFGGAGCQEASPGISVNIAAQVKDSGGETIDLGKAYEGDWDRVCVLGPTAGNATVRRTLGFEWDAEGKSAILTNDGIALLLFVRGKEVVAYAEHPRNLGDFANLAGQCFTPERARFYERKQGAAGMYLKEGP